MATTTPSKSRQQPKKKSAQQGKSQQGRPQQGQQQQQSQGQQGASLQKRVDAALARLEKKDPGLKQLLKKAHGYCVFPSVGKAALVVGGAYGRGAVFEKGKLIGYATLSQMTIGVQIGGDTFTEILVFHDPGQLDKFKKGHMAFAANASAVLVKAAAAGTTDFKGVTALAYSSGGMLLELALGGQKFSFKPLGGGGGEQGKGKSGGAKSSQDQGEEEEEGDAGGSESEEEESEDGGEGMLGRALGGVSKVPELAKGHPIVATVLGAGALTGLAFMLVRALRQGSMGGSNSDSDSEEQDDQEDEEQDTDAQGSDEGEEEDYDEEEEDDEGEEEEQRGSSSRRRGGRSRV